MSNTRRSISRRAYWLVGVSVLIAASLIAASILARPAPSPKPSSTASTVSPIPLAAGTSFPATYQPYTLNGRAARLGYGQRATVIVFMASWCKYCAYDDAYVWPELTKQQGVAVDIVDVSPYSGIGTPGPKSPPWQGTDGTGHLVDRQGMIGVMQTYVAQFHLSQPGVHVFVDPAGTKRWPIKYFPTAVFLNAQKQVTQVSSGGVTLSQATSLLKVALR
ncbi:MAG: hypothetical protein M0Z53_06295 [Thermaerobacter sp.]|nr:hypothetical protein [Thermaerobacter sp.]